MADYSKPPPFPPQPPPPPPPPPAVGYPAPYPYPNPNYPHPNYYQIPRRSRFASGLLLSIIIMGSIFLTLMLMSLPNSPEFNVTLFSLWDFNSSSSPSGLSGKWEVKMVAKNLDRKTVMHYDRIDAFVFYDDESLSQTSLQPFVLERENEMEVSAMFAAGDGGVEKWVVDGIDKDRTKGIVEFNVRLVAVVRFKTQIWPTRTRWVRVFCEDLGVGLTSATRNGSLVGGGKRRCIVG